MKTKYTAIDALAGSGKTYSAVKHISETQFDQKRIVIFPSKVLMDEVARLVYSKFPIQNFYNIHSPEIISDYNVLSEFNKAFEAVQNQGFGTILLTHYSFCNLIPKSFWKSFSDWTLVCDETFPMFTEHKINLTRNRHQLLKYIRLGEKMTGDRYFVEPVIKNIEEGLNLIQEQEKIHDDIDELLYPIIKAVYTAGVQVDVNALQWKKVFVDLDHDKKTKYEKIYSKNQVSFTCSIDFTRLMGFKEFILMSAFVKHHYMYNEMERRMGIAWEQNNAIGQGLRYEFHNDIGSRLNIVVCAENSRSKKKLYSIEDNGAALIENLFDKVAKYLSVHQLANNSTGIQLNNDAWLTYGAQLTNWRKIPVVSHGLNSFQDVTNFIGFAALNFTPGFAASMIDRGYHYDFQDSERTHNALYQGIMRTNIRDPLSNKNVNVFVLDFVEADMLLEIFPGATVTDIEGNRPKKRSIRLGKRDQAAKDTVDLLQKTDSNAELLKDKNTISFEELKLRDLKKNSIESILATEMHFSLEYKNAKPLQKQNYSSTMVPFDTVVSKINLNYFADDYGPNLYVKHSKTKEMPIADQVSLFSKMTKAYIVDAKEDVPLYTPAIFKETGRFDQETGKEISDRLKDNVIGMQYIVLDIDGGDMTATHLLSIIKNDLACTAIIYSSVSNGIKAGGERYRAHIYVNRTMNMDEYETIYDYILKRVDSAGFTTLRHTQDVFEWREKNPKGKISGIDLSKRNGSSVFYHPAVINGNEKNMFFHKVYTTTRDMTERNRLLNVDKILSYSPIRREKDETIVTVEIDDDNTSNTEQKEIIAKEDQKLSKIVEKRFELLQPGNRSYLSLTIVPIIKKIQDRELRETLFHRLITEYGLDKSAVKSCRDYYKG